MAKQIKTNQLPLQTDLTNAKVIGLDKDGKDVQMPLANLLRSEKGIALPSTVPSGLRFAGETWLISPENYGSTFTNFNGINVPIKVGSQYVTNARFVYNAGAWKLERELVDAPSVTDYLSKSEAETGYSKNAVTPTFNQVLKFDQDKIIQSYNTAASVSFSLDTLGNLSGKVIRAEVGEKVTGVSFTFSTGMVNGDFVAGLSNIIYFNYIGDGFVDVFISQGNRRPVVVPIGNISSSVKLLNTNLPTNGTAVTTWTDLSGNSRSAVKPAYISDNAVVANENLSMNGAKEMLAIPNYAVSLDNKFSVAFRGKIGADVTGTKLTLIGQFSTYNNQRHWRVFTIFQTQIGIAIYNAAGVTVVKEYIIQGLTVGEEFSMVFTFNAGSLLCYKNGQKIAPTVINSDGISAFPISTLPVTIGNYQNNSIVSGDPSFKGEIKRLITADRVLTLDEIASI